MTTAMGWAWVAVLEKYLVNGDLSDVDSIRAVFVEEFKARFKSSLAAGSPSAAAGE